MVENVASDPPADRPPLTPEARRRDEGITGTPVVMSDGREWLLAPYVPALGSVWDALFDGAMLEGQYGGEELRTAAWRLLAANYALTPNEFLALIPDAEIDALAHAVDVAFHGDQTEPFGWTHWVKANLWANGINPAHVPPPDLQVVLMGLAAAKKLIPRETLIASVHYIASRDI